ncbi:MAG TPA: hypothetical protein VF123_00455 [Candidatus Sulfotelmatobacter sp.]
MSKLWVTALLCLVSFAYGQDVPHSYPFVKLNQEVRVAHLPRLAARSPDPSFVLLTSLDTIFHDQSICCTKDSALGDSAAAADGRSVKDIVAKLEGRHLLSDGRPVMIDVLDLAPQVTRNPGTVVRALTNKRAMLLKWNSHLYVLYGALFDEAQYADGSLAETINQLFLLDPRYSDSRREVSFKREKDDWNQVEGLLLLSVSPQ